MTHRERNAIDKVEFQKACLNYRIDCLAHVIDLAPLPEFKKALEDLESLRDRNLKNTTPLKKVYQDLNRGHKVKMSYYGYTAVGEIYLGLLRVLYRTIHPQDEIWNSDCQNFVEACYLAAGHVSPSDKMLDWSSYAQKEENDWQDKKYHEIFDAYGAAVNKRREECMEAKQGANVPVAAGDPEEVPV